jgi:hypothetical protein
MKRSRLVLLAAVTGLAGEVQAQEDEPDLGFLEYLGSWQESDEEWLIVAGMEEELDDHGEASAKGDGRVEDEETDETDETDTDEN